MTFDRRAGQREFYVRAKSVFEKYAESSAKLGDVVFDEASIEFVVQAYFLLNDEYRVWRMQPSHHTNSAKMAAISAVSLMQIRPYYSLSGIESEWLFYSNPLFALMAGAGIVGQSDFTKFPSDTVTRLCCVFDSLRLPNLIESVEKSQRLAEVGDFPTKEEIGFKLEVGQVVQIDMIVSIFELVSGYNPKTGESES